jgi:uncharacterized protein YgiM (DUF1202 family)
MRNRPAATAQLVGRPANNTPLTVRDDPERAKVLVGRYGEWLYVETPTGKQGWVAAWYVQVYVPSFAPLGLEPGPAPAGAVIVYASEALSVRKGPSLNTSRVAIALPHEPLTALGDKRAALSRLGRQGEWLQVRLPDESKGYVAAWYVGIEAGLAPSEQLTVYPLQDMNMRQRPTVTSRLVQQLERGAPLTVHDDPVRARVLVGRYDEWLYVETEEGQRGWVAAWYVSDTAI